MSSLVEISIGKSMLIQVGNFLLFMFVLNIFLFKPIIKFLESRGGTIQGNRATAEQKEQEARELLDNYLEAIDNANREAAEALAGIRREAELKQREMLEEARDQAGQVISRAIEEIKGTAEDARGQLREETRRISRSIAEKLLGRTLA